MANEGEIRCYCNLAVCVSTGYMCKSGVGSCFSEVSGRRDVGHSRHGCVEMLHETRREACQRHFRNISTIRSDQWPLVMCCAEDMCNYVDSVDIKIRVNGRTNRNRTHKGILSPTMEEGEFFVGKSPEGVGRQDVWFKAAVIAVPIAGGFILVMLILLAIHMLRKDNRRQRQIVELRRLRRFKSHLLVDDEDSLPRTMDKNDAKAGANEKSSNMYANMNIAISRDSYANDKHHAGYQILRKPFGEAFCNAMVGTWSSGKVPSTPV